MPPFEQLVVSSSRRGLGIGASAAAPGHLFSISIVRAAGWRMMRGGCVRRTRWRAQRTFLGELLKNDRERCGGFRLAGVLLSATFRAKLGAMTRCLSRAREQNTKPD